MHRLICALIALTVAACVSLPPTAPPGVRINADEARACAVDGCSVWTEDELRELMRRAFIEGWNAAIKSGA